MGTIWVDLLGAETRFYDAGGLRTRCIQAGSGEPLIFLHGSGGHAEAYSRNVIPLSERFRVCAIDMIGHGLTDKPETGYQAPDYAGHVVRFMDAAGIDRAHLAGESLGGWVATWVGLLYPDRVRKIVSVTGAGLEQPMDAEDQASEEKGRGDLRRLTRQFVENPTKENLRLRLSWLFNNPQRDISEELLELRWKLYTMPGMSEALSRSSQPGTGPSNPKYALPPEKLRELKAPYLFLWTDHNPTTSAAKARRVQEQVPGSQFVLLRDCAHWPQWEDRDAFNRAVSSFLSS